MITDVSHSSHYRCVHCQLEIRYMLLLSAGCSGDRIIPIPYFSPGDPLGLAWWPSIPTPLHHPGLPSLLPNTTMCTPQCIFLLFSVLRALIRSPARTPPGRSHCSTSPGGYSRHKCQVGLRSDLELEGPKVAHLLGSTYALRRAPPLHAPLPLSLT